MIPCCKADWSGKLAQLSDLRPAASFQQGDKNMFIKLNNKRLICQDKGILLCHENNYFLIMCFDFLR